jgi:aspartyl-tRNA(Asn)/glutamyl-tRNA(Gln) amidotransferase subunit B
MKHGKPPIRIVEEKGWRRIADEDLLRKMVEEVFTENPKAVQDALQDSKATHYLVGKIMEKTRGMADPELTYKLISEKLSKLRG